MGHNPLHIAIIAAVFAGSVLLCGADSPPHPAPAALRHPVALVLSPDGNRLFVANRSGSVAIVDTNRKIVIAEYAVGQRLADLTLSSDGKLLIVDEAAGELIECMPRDNRLEIERRAPVPASPVCVRVDGERLMVASLWSRRLTVVDHGKQRVVELPFAPRLLLPLAGQNKVIVADSFGGTVAIVDTGACKIEALRVLEAHAIRGLALRGDQVLLAHQVLVQRTPTTAEEMHWGNVLHQELRSLKLSTLLASTEQWLRDEESRPLGEPGRGAGDPSGIAVAADGTTVVTSGGTGQILFGKPKDVAWRRLDMGRRPTAVVLSADGKRAFVADSSEDVIVVVDPRQAKVDGKISLGTRPTLTSAERGEQLFYDARLSREGWMSCHSCHVDGHSNGGLSDTLSDGGFGAPKRVLSLLGVKDTGPWTWIGTSPDLAGQIHKSIATTMRSLHVRDDQVADLAAYLQTLTPPPPILPLDNGGAERGRQVFQRQGCVNCHAPPTYTTPKTYDVGLHDEAGNHTFNPPSLRGVGQSGPYFHDGRATTLEEVFLRFGHPAPVPREDIADLVRFLKAL